MITERKCNVCNLVKPLGEYYNNHRFPLGKNYTCKACCTAYYQSEQYKQLDRERRRTPEGKVKEAERAKKARFGPLRAKRLARDRVGDAIRSGKIIKPSTCSTCGKTGRIEAHHPNGYAKEHQLDIVWICASCHHSIHR